MLVAPEGLDKLFMGLGYGLILNLFFSIGQMQGYDFFPTVVNPAGLFVNKNMLAEVSALVLVGLVGYGRYYLASVPASLLAVTTCRGAWVGVALAGAVWAWRYYRTAAVSIVALSVVGLFLISPYLPGAPVGATPIVRLRIWLDALDGVTVFGHGTGSFFSQFPLFQHRSTDGTQRFANAHNDFLQILFENGWVGLIVFLGFLLFTLRSAARVERYVLIAFMGEAFFGYPFYLPVTEFVFGVAAGSLLRSRPAIRGLLDDVRSTLRARLALFAHRSRSPGQPASQFGPVSS